jgi:hypothetical protein
MSESESRLSLKSGRFAALVLLIFVVQVTLIFWLSDRRTPMAASRPPQPEVVLVNEDPHELLRFWNPSLFGLPHYEGFSGAAWMQSSPPESRPFDWTEEPRWLPVPIEPFESLLARFSSGSNAASPLAMGLKESDVATPGMLRVDLLPERSRLRILSMDASAEWTPAPNLPSWPHTDLVSSSIVQVVIRSDGTVLSAALLESSGCAPADEFALGAARQLRFARSDTISQPRWTHLDFEWHTLSAPQEKTL